jgi:hypothetical protein
LGDSDGAGKSGIIQPVVLIDQEPMHLWRSADGPSNGQQRGAKEVDEQRKPIDQGQAHELLCGEWGDKIG